MTGDLTLYLVAGAAVVILVTGLVADVVMSRQRRRDDLWHLVAALTAERDNLRAAVDELIELYLTSARAGLEAANEMNELWRQGDDLEAAMLEALNTLPGKETTDDNSQD
jgi:hypothetical protein